MRMADEAGVKRPVSSSARPSGLDFSRRRNAGVSTRFAVVVPRSQASSMARRCCRICARARLSRDATVPRGIAEMRRDLGQVHLLELVQQEHRAQGRVHAADDVVEELPHLLATGEVLRRRERLDALGRAIVHHLTPAGELAPRVRRQIDRHLKQEAPLRAQVHVVDAAGDGDEGPLDLVVQVGRGDAGLAQRAGDEVEVLVDHPADACLLVGRPGDDRGFGRKRT